MDEKWGHIIEYNNHYYAIFYRWKPITQLLAKQCLIDTLNDNKPEYIIRFQQCSSIEDAEIELKNLAYPEPKGLPKDVEDLMDKPVFPSLFAGIGIAMLILGALAMLQKVLHPNG